MSAYPEIYVGKYSNGKKPQLPPGVRGILIHTSSKTLGGALSPYQLCDSKGRLLENMWQFSKVYSKVTEQKIIKSRFHPEVIWCHPEEIHFEEDDDQLTDEFWAWRHKGMHSEEAIRYPNGYTGRNACLFAVPLSAKPNKPIKKLDYIEARKRIYCRIYRHLAPKHPEFAKLKKMMDKGQSLCIIEVDGPDVEFYRDSEISDSIVGSVMKIDERTIKYLLRDPSKPFGHGFVIAALLLGGEKWLR